MTDADEKTVILGPENDQSLRVTLRKVMNRLGGESLSHSWGVGGSQELETALVQFGDALVVIEAETYVGLSIRGPVELIDRIQDMVKSATQRVD